MQDNIYRDIILDHWQNPQNYGVINNADFKILGSNPLCGDEIRITAKISKGKIAEIAFTSDGCAISKASASVFTEFVKNKSKVEIKKITPDEVLTYLGVDLTPTRTKCALLVYSTLKKGLKAKD